MGRGTKRGWYERKEEKRVTLDWVKMNCHPTKREMEILKVVYDRKLVRRDHLEILCKSYRDVGVNRTKIVNRAIGRLFTSLCLDKIHEKGTPLGNTPSVVAVDKGGSILLNVPHKKRIQHEVKNVKDKQYIFRILPNYYRHVHGINQVEVDIINLGQDIIEWVHERPASFHYGHEQITVIPDVFAKFKINSKDILSFIEYDTGSEDRGNKSNFPTIYRKLLHYKKYRASRIWRDEMDYFPTILFVTEDEKRIPYVNKKLKELGLNGFGIYYKNFTKFFERLAMSV